MLGHKEDSYKEYWFYTGGRGDIRIRHRIDKPALISSKSNIYFVAGKEHNLNNPSYSKSTNSVKEYFLAGNYHNITGPSVSSSVEVFFYINGVEYTEAEYNRILKIK